MSSIYTFRAGTLCRDAAVPGIDDEIANLVGATLMKPVNTVCSIAAFGDNRTAVNVDRDIATPILAIDPKAGSPRTRGRDGNRARSECDVFARVGIVAQIGKENAICLVSRCRDGDARIQGCSR